MASSQTTNYSLPQWSKSDRIQMSDFNTAMSTIDAALAGAPKIAVGAYTGTGEYGESHKNSLTFSFVPKLVVIAAANSTERATVWINGMTLSQTGASSVYCSYFSLSGTTLSWYNFNGGSDYAGSQLNKANTTYRYFALG